MKIIAYRTNSDLDIEFMDDFHYVKKHAMYSNFTSGSVKNPYDKTIYGVGYIGTGKYLSHNNGKHNYVYDTWHDMLRRCYHHESKLFNAYYETCIVCAEWHNYQAFAKWYEEREYPVSERLHLDKDILHKGNKVYSPENCLLTPQRINMLFANKPNKRGLPNGIAKNSKGYSAKYAGTDLGSFITFEEAYNKYAKEKEKRIVEIANEYKSIIPDNVYEALINYKVDVTVDKNYVA